MTDKTPLLADNEIKALAREAGCPVVTDRDGIMSFQAYGDNLRKFVALVAELAAGAQPAPDVPEGWKLVPVEPTDEMLMYVIGFTLMDRDTLRDNYAAMLAAAPEAQKAKENSND